MAVVSVLAAIVLITEKQMLCVKTVETKQKTTTIFQGANVKEKQ